MMAFILRTLPRDGLQENSVQPAAGWAQLLQGFGIAQDHLDRVAQIVRHRVGKGIQLFVACPQAVGQLPQLFDQPRVFHCRSPPDRRRR